MMGRTLRNLGVPTWFLGDHISIQKLIHPDAANLSSELTAALSILYKGATLIGSLCFLECYDGKGVAADSPGGRDHKDMEWGGEASTWGRLRAGSSWHLYAEGKAVIWTESSCSYERRKPQWK